MAKQHHPIDAWLMAVPDDVYQPCPCGCGKKWRYIEREGEKEIEIHFRVFEQNLIHGQVFKKERK